MKPPVLIEVCDFERFPTGGQLTFARNLLNAWGPELALIGCEAGKPAAPSGKWTKKKLNGKEFDFFSLGNVKDPEHKSLIPKRIWGFFRMLLNRKKLHLEKYSDIIIRAPEILFTLPASALSRTTIILPGLENPLRISRYFYAKWFAGLYNALLYRRLAKLKMVLAAADRREIAAFAAASHGRLAAERVMMFPTCYPENIFHPMDRVEVRRKLDIPAEVKMVVTVGRIGRYKGWRFMLDAFAEFSASAPNARFYLVGDGEDSAELAAAAAEPGLAGKVFPLGRRPPEAVAELLAAADLFIMGSYKEGWCTALVEAVACGAPCCVTDFSSAAELVQNGVNGFVVPERDEKLFAEKMAEAVALPPTGAAAAAASIREFGVSMLKMKLSAAIGRSCEK